MAPFRTSAVGGNERVRGKVPDSNSSVFYSVQSFTNRANGTEVSLVTLHAADHNPYEESYLRVPGNGGTVDTNGIAWSSCPVLKGIQDIILRSRAMIGTY